MEAQIESWKKYCGKQDREGVWEGIYRVIGRTTKRQEDELLSTGGKTLSPKESATLLAETFYPEDSQEEDNADHKAIRILADQVNEDQNEHHDPPFTLQELQTAVVSFNPKKAPGADGLTADICAEAISSDPDTYLAIANKCLELSHFPRPWKRAIVIILRKPAKKDYSQPKSHRPIGLLSVMGKILEKMLVGRLKHCLYPRLSTHQYGFMPQRSTEDSLYAMMNHIHSTLNQKKLTIVISLDIEGAFDSAWWPAIRVRLAEEKCPINIRRVIDSYLCERTVEVRYAGETHSRSTFKGCVQGSIGGPILWNLLLDPLLKGLSEKGNYCQAFADDVVMIFDGDTALEVQGQANAALAYVRDWGVRNKLKFSAHKTQAMVITRKRKYDTPILSMGGIDIGLSKEIKILGLTIDSSLTFNQHIVNICQKVMNIFKQLSRAARISWGLHSEVIRVIYTAVVEPIVTYASSAWAKASKKLGVQKRLNTLQRSFAIKICRAYRTVSLHSALLLAGMLPLDLRVRETAALYEARKGSSRLVLGNQEVERVVDFGEIPHPALQRRLSYTELTDETQVSEYNTQQIRCFTDGSKIEGKVGAGISMWDNETEIKSVKLALSVYCTVYQAELLAISKAAAEILRRKETTFGIYSDSRSALQSVANYNVLHPLAVEARKNLDGALSQGKVVSLFWIKAHAGLAGNERADCLAKEAALTCRGRPDYDRCPVSLVKRHARSESIEEWSRRYRDGATASITKMFLPEAKNAYKVVKNLQPNGVLTQLLTGHGGFSQYLHRFKCRESPSCICDHESIESVPHLLFHCPVYERDRFDIEANLETQVNENNVNEIIANKKLRKKYLEFCIKICKNVINRNK